MKKNTLSICAILILNFSIYSQNVPAVYSNFEFNANKNLVFTHNDTNISVIEYLPLFTLNSFTNKITGTQTGIEFQFNMPDFKGKLYYGFVHYSDSKYPLPVYFKNYATIDNGYVHIDIKNQLGGRYDIIDWESVGRGILGYRIIDNKGNMIYEGRVAFTGTGAFNIGNVITEGPFVDQITSVSAIISLKTYKPTFAEVIVNDKTYKSKQKVKYHEIIIDKLKPATNYNYSITIDGIKQSYAFKTAPEQGSRIPFTFAYASDSRSGTGGGERDLHGTNYYILKKIMALATQQKAVFMQFTGDLISGYLTNQQETNFQYANWKRAIEPWAHYMPVYEGMGNHEALVFAVPYKTSWGGLFIDKFPFETKSAEAVFNSNFVNPTNGPKSEDGAAYDPDPKNTDFPPYTENVYHYSYDNLAVICLNSDYLYAPTLSVMHFTGGNLHGYIMDNQLKWLLKVIEDYEKNENIDHIFITQHTPAFPNGGHVQDDMWYNGNNQFRAWIAGRPLPKGIIERRDEYLDIIVNKSSKVVGILTGDEHNYCRTTINPEMPIYPKTGYFANKIELTRTIYQINNGAAGAPYYAQQQVPWSGHVAGFTTQNALVLIHVAGKKVELEVLNPDTLEEIDRLILRQ